MSDLPHPVPKRRMAASRSILALMLREIGATHGRSSAGYLWSIGEPVAGIALLSFVFSAAFETPALGVSFALFYATGMVPYSMFNGINNKLSQALNFSRSLLMYPVVTPVDAVIARYLLNILTEAVIAVLVFAGVLALFDTSVALDLPRVVLGFVLTACLAGGFGTLNCYLVLQFPAWQSLWGIAMKPMFVLSGVFYLYDTIPRPYQDWLWWNPLVHIVGIIRAGFYGGYDAHYASPGYVCALAGIALVVGLAMLRKDGRVLILR